jgi:hypothetical protein
MLLKMNTLSRNEPFIKVSPRSKSSKARKSLKSIGRALVELRQPNLDSKGLKVS